MEIHNSFEFTRESDDFQVFLQTESDSENDSNDDVCKTKKSSSR